MQIGSLDAQSAAAYYYMMAFYEVLADFVLVVHFAYVSFVVLGMAAILLGVVLHWQWVRNFWFRIIHLLMIAIVVVESILGIVCPLTAWEDQLRGFSGEIDQPDTFIGRWLGRILFFDVPPPVMTVCYCVFGVAVLMTMYFAPPRWPWNKKTR